MNQHSQADQPHSVDPTTWVDQYGDFLYRYAALRLRDTNGAEEVVQEAFLSALQHVDQYQGKGSERAWLLGILKRKVIDHVRARNRTTNLAEDEGNELSDALFDRRGNWSSAVQSTVCPPLDSLERQEFWRILQTCLDSIPTRQADVFVLREMNDISTDEICKDLGVTASNVWVLLYRARLQLSNCMKSRWYQETA